MPPQQSNERHFLQGRPSNEHSPLLLGRDDAAEAEMGQVCPVVDALRQDCFGGTKTPKYGLYQSFRGILMLGETTPPSSSSLSPLSPLLVERHRKIQCMLVGSVLSLVVLLCLTNVAVRSVPPPKLPIGPYLLKELHEGESFFDAYTFLDGPDSVGSHGYNTYVTQDVAWERGIANVTWENGQSQHNGLRVEASEPFVYMGSAPTADGPRESIRIQSLQQYDRGLFILDVRHMPAACGAWPAFWLTDMETWPQNGEIDICESVNYQSTAKTALHSVQGCTMHDAPLGTMTGDWEDVQGVPDILTGKPDMTRRQARDCFVYAPDQWLNQGCVVAESDDGTIGAPLNDKGGGVYVLEWDPVHSHIRSWVFAPHETMPENLRQTLNTASLPALEERVSPDPDSWHVLPYAHFPIGAGTNCASSPFGHMHIVFNIAFCGSAAGDRYTLDCPRQAAIYETCENWIQSQPDELLEAYWKIRGVYIYERKWLHA